MNVLDTFLLVLKKHSKHIIIRVIVIILPINIIAIDTENLSYANPISSNNMIS